MTNDIQQHPQKAKVKDEKTLTGVTVLEYAKFVAAPYCAKLLADLGAEAIKIEEPGKGDEARRWGPFPGDMPHPEKSGLFLYLNTNKLGITLNLNTNTGQEIFKRLLETADILVEDNPPRLAKELRLSYQALKEINPRLILTSITPFGQSGPYADYEAYYLNTYHGAMSGYLTPYGSSNPDREPLKVGGLAGEYCCGLSAAVATLGALYFQQLSGQGQHVDVSKQEALIGLDRINAARYQNEGVNPTRLTPLHKMFRLTACRDGYVALNLAEDHQWAGFARLIGKPEWGEDERYRTLFRRLENFEEVAPFIQEWFSLHTKEEIYHSAQKSGCPFTPARTAEGVVNSQQSKARGFFTEIDHPEAGRFKYPTSPFLFSKTLREIARPAPLLGEHNEEIYIKRLGYERGQLAEIAKAGVI